jgi:iron complex transport system ATP-binding protein
MISFVDIVARYPRSERAALDGVSLTAASGEITAVVGPNGSGKSTLVRTLLGIVPREGGRRTVRGDALASLDRRELARRVAVVTQSESIAFALPVREYVALGRYPHEGAWSAEGGGSDDALAIERAMKLAGVTAMASRGTDELSGGEWQRVRIARALAQGGGAIVLDEPSTFLDVGHEMAMFELFAHLAREGMAVLLVSHQLNLVARFAHRLVLLHHGRVAAVGPPSEVMRAPVLERVYDWPLVITRDPAVGAPALLPLRKPQG